ncbi:MAG TPA: two-component regulator propeller domain-containing protein, partial [Bacteroidia bacterium]|nr:two-component regulator propeller domain-containing protein [Bacteroidia bacterium]
FDGNRVDAIERGDTVDTRTHQYFIKAKGKFIKSLPDRKTGFTNYTTAQGLANNWVWDIKEDKSGNIWFATYGGGVSCYDGKNFTNFNTQQGLANNFVFCITEDKSGNLWFGTEGGGVSRYDGKSFTNYTAEQGLGKNVVCSIMEDKTGNLWFGTEGGGVSCYDGNKVETIKSEDTIGNRVQHVKRVSQAAIKSFTNYTVNQGLLMNDVLCSVEDKIGNLWFGTYNGVSRYDGNRVEAIERGDTIAACIQQDLKKVNGKLAKSFTNYLTWHGRPAYNSVVSIKEDKFGNLWFGTKRGIIRYDGNRVDLIESGDIKATKYQQGLKKINGKFVKSFTYYTTEQGMVDDFVICITEDKIGNLWFGTKNGAIRYDGNRVEVIASGDTTTRGSLQTLKKINGKFVKSFTNYTTAQGLINNKVNCIVEDKMGNIWLGTDGGISRYDGKSFTNYTTTQGLSGNTVTQAAITSEGNVLFGTNLGLSMLTSFSLKGKETQQISSQNNLNNKELEKYIPVFEIYNSSTGYPVKDVNTGQNAMYVDSKGIIWIATCSDKTGLVRFDYKALHKNNNPLNVFIQGIKINNEKIVWNDLNTRLKIKNIQPDSTTTPPSITEEVTVFGKVLSEGERDTIRQKFGNVKFDSVTKFYPIPENLVLPYVHNHITFDYAAIEPAKPYLVRYQYMLEGYDKDWNPITDQTSAVFGNMYEGTYTFKLKARSPFGVWSEPIKYKFTVLPPWWRSRWMYVVYSVIFLLIIISIYFFVVHRIKTIRKREEEKTILNKQVSDIKMKALRSQMNPHFIFNVMNSIQNYILKNDRANAQDYLAKFSHLMRRILENSKSDTITLENEIETLKLYLLLEQLRSPGKFTYSIEVESSISTLSTLIIPMLIQPFIENAIIHGIMHKKGNDGKIALTIRRSNDQLVCVIEDNGIGRKSSNKIKAAGSRAHKSFGMNVTEERISLLNTLYGKIASVAIEDQTDDALNPIGTKVTLTIPYIIQDDQF